MARCALRSAWSLCCFHLCKFKPSSRRTRARRAEKRSAFRRNILASDKVGGLRSAYPPYTGSATSDPSPLSRDEARPVGERGGGFDHSADPQHHLLVEGA